VTGAHRFVVSKSARKYYYCDSDSAWHGLAQANLLWFDSEDAVRAAFPKLVLHEACRD
jgi:hypothetical protein